MSHKRPVTILAVDDNAHVRRLVERILKATHQEHFLLQARDGAEALRLFDSYEVGFVILDVNLPILNGIEVCRKIRSLKAAVPILAIGGLPADLPKMMEAGATDSIEKPFSPGMLQRKLLAMGAFP